MHSPNLASALDFAKSRPAKKPELNMLLTSSFCCLMFDGFVIYNILTYVFHLHHDFSAGCHPVIDIYLLQKIPYEWSRATFNH